MLLSFFSRGRRTKESREFDYWRKRAKTEGVLSNDHYEQFYTTYFGIDRDFYRGKRILDVGCGPRGSLEWVPEDCEAFGVDPLVEKYLELGASTHRMRYIQAGAEKLPFPDSNFDAVFSFNNLDHVENVEEAVSEICRVLRPGGLCLLIVDINHAPKVCEPHTVKASVAESFGMVIEDRRFYHSDEIKGCYETLENEKWRCADDGTTSMWMAVKMCKR